MSPAAQEAARAAASRATGRPEDDPVTETEAVIVKYKLRGDFPDDVLAAARANAVHGRAEARRTVEQHAARRIVRHGEETV